MTHSLVATVLLTGLALVAGANVAGAASASTAPPSASAASPPVGAAAPQLLLHACQLEHPEHLLTVAAECGRLSVPENPARPSGRQIRLYVARVPAISRRKQPDPLFVLAGGPGMAATTFYATVAPVFGRIHRDRDIVLVDQRGTGRSNALNCELSEDAVAQESDEQIVADARRCLKDVSSHADPAYYTTSIAVTDLDRVRAALGYDRIDLYGGSYGTRVAQQYLRRYSSHTRSVILDGVVPPTAALGPEVATDAEDTLLAILGHCAGTPACREHFGDPIADYRKLSAQLKARSVPVTLADPTTGDTSNLELTMLQLATVLRLASYTPQEAALLPLILHRAGERDDFRPLASQYLLVSRSIEESISYGMHNSVVCSEDVPYFDVSKIDREKLARTYLGTAAVDGLRDICQVWPRGPIDADFHEPLHTPIPALLLSGSHDPATPAAYGALAANGFTHALHLVVNGFGHGQLTTPCVDRVMAAFIASGSTAGLDTSCIRLARAMPFFTSLNGPPP